MPTYEYRCRQCGERLEAVQAFSDAPLTVCPACDGELRKVFGSVGIVFKGSGFYKTDSRSQSATSTAASSSSEKSETSKTEAAKSETKTESKAESKPETKAEPASTSKTAAAAAAS